MGMGMGQAQVVIIVVQFQANTQHAIKTVDRNNRKEYRPLVLFELGCPLGCLNEKAECTLAMPLYIVCCKIVSVTRPVEGKIPEGAGAKIYILTPDF